MRRNIESRWSTWFLLGGATRRGAPALNWQIERVLRPSTVGCRSVNSGRTSHDRAGPLVDAIAKPAVAKLGGGVGKGAEAVVGGGQNVDGIDDALTVARELAVQWGS